MDLLAALAVVVLVVCFAGIIFQYTWPFLLLAAVLYVVWTYGFILPLWAYIIAAVVLYTAIISLEGWPHYENQSNSSVEDDDDEDDEETPSPFENLEENMD